MKKSLRAYNLLFVLLLVPLSIFLLYPDDCFAAAAKKKSQPKPPAKIEQISPPELRVLIDMGRNPVIVDTQSEEAFKRMHIPGAVNLPYSEMIVEPNLPRNRLLVVYCDCPDESSSSDIARQLVQYWKYTEVKVLKSGLKGWICMDYAVEGESSGQNFCQ